MIKLSFNIKLQNSIDDKHTLKNVPTYFLIIKPDILSYINKSIDL